MATSKPASKSLSTDFPSASNDANRITQELYKRNMELAARNKTLMLLRNIDEIVLGAVPASTDCTSQAIAQLLVDEADFNLAMIYVVQDKKKYAIPDGIAASTMLATNLSPDLKFKLQLSSLKFDYPADSSVQYTSHLQDLLPSIKIETLRLLRENLLVKSYFVSILRAKQDVIGVLILGLPLTKDEASSYQRILAEQLTSAIAIAIENRLLYRDLQKATARLKDQNTKLKTLDALKDDFISMASHQLRTPATSVHEAIQMLGDKSLTTAEFKKILQIAEASSEHLVSVILNMLSIARIQAGHFIAQKTAANLGQLSKRATEELGAKAEQHNVELKLNKLNTPLIIQADTAKINEAMTNLIDNAIKYSSGRNTVTINVSARANRVYFEVCDEGIGVPEAERKNIFSKFFRAKNARLDHPDGNGIGLFFVKATAQAHGGDAYYKPLPKGSVFGFWLPVL